MEVDVNFVRNDITSERFCTKEETETRGEKTEEDPSGSDAGDEEVTRIKMATVAVEERKWRARACYDTVIMNPPFGTR